MTTAFTNCRLCLHGQLLPDSCFTISNDTGMIIGRTQNVPIQADRYIDLQNRIVAPGFLELQTNGLRGFHFTHFDDEESYGKKIEEVATYLPSQGVTGFYATIPTVKSEEFKKVSIPFPSSSQNRQTLTRRSRSCHLFIHERSKVVHVSSAPTRKGHTSIPVRKVHTTPNSSTCHLLHR